MTWKDLFRGEKKLKWIVILGVAGIALIFLSSFFGGTKKEAVTTEPEKETINEEYALKYQKQAEELLSKIGGVGRSYVTVTLESGVEYVYVKEESRDSDYQKGEGEKVTERDSTAQKTILVEDENGRKKALLRTSLEPTVRGVVVACEGGDDPEVVAQVTEAMQTLFGIRSTKVCVTKMSGSSK